MWTKNDERFLRTMCITATHPPPPLPRFRVEAGDVAGWYRVIDAEKRFQKHQDFGPAVGDPRAAAEAMAVRLNAKHVTNARKGDDEDGA